MVLSLLLRKYMIVICVVFMAANMLPCFSECTKGSRRGPTEDGPETSEGFSQEFITFALKDKKKKFKTVSAALAEYGEAVRKKLAPLFAAANVAYPPAELTWIGLKKEKRLLVFARDKHGKMRLLLSYPVIGASGKAGPKLKEGDKQVPEGFYKIDGFRPNVIAHLGLAIDYPNTEDRKHAKEDRRINPGGDILIHGSLWSSGCLAMGNPAIEELFVLAHDTGCKKISVILSPCNLLQTDAGLDLAKQPPWLKILYKRIRDALLAYPLDAKALCELQIE